MLDDSDKPATKADLKKAFAHFDKTIGRVEMKIDRVAAALINIQANVKEINHFMATKMADKDDIRRVLNAINALANKSENHRKAVVDDLALPEVKFGSA